MNPAQILTARTVRPSAYAEPVEALAIADGRVRGTGTLAAMRSLLPKAEVHDLGDATILPGLVESHVHPIFFGLTQGWIDCRSPLNSSIADVQTRLREALGTVAEGAWLRGWGYDDTLLAENRHLERSDLDAVSREVPIVVTHISGHFLGANSAALRLAGVDADTPEPAEGHVVRDETGEPTGLLWEMGAVALVLDAVPEPDPATLVEAARTATATAARRGMTTVHDLGVGLIAGMPELETWRRLSAAGDLPVRVLGYLRGDLALPRLDEGLFGETPDDAGAAPSFRLVGAKFWADGSIQGLSAALQQPYSCADTCGDLLYDVERLTRVMCAIDAAGGQCAVHANGDRAAATVVAALRGVRRANPQGTTRHRVEHLQVADPADIAALVDLGGGASLFANHVRFWGDRHRDRFLGPERAARIDPGVDALTAGLRFGLHSDCPITPMDSLQTMATAVTRRTSGGAVLGAEQALTPAQALHALTLDSAWLGGVEDRSGTLETGRDADLVVVDRDVLAGDPQDITEAQVRGTMVAGRWAYQA